MSKSVSKRIGLVSIALIVFAVVLMTLGSAAFAGTGDHSAVVGSLHDIGVGDNPCESCHLPHHGGDAFLWAGNPNSSGGGSSVAAGGSTAIKPLCYSCHDGTATSLGGDTVFDALKEQHMTRSKAAYGKTGRDCDLCHDPHDGTRENFIRYQRLNSTKVIGTVGPNVCVSCHTDKVEGGLDRFGAGPFHNHPVDIAASSAINPSAVTYDPSSDTWGTRLFETQTKCESCHAPHGAYNDLLNTMSTVDGALCINCHK